MKWRLMILLGLLILGDPGNSPGKSASSAEGNADVRGVPLREVAPPLRDLWLRFHEDQLCQGLDTVFVFQPKGLEIWCRVQEDKPYQELGSLIEPLKKSYRIAVYATHPVRDKKPYSPENDDPLPSLWNNAELRLNFRDLTGGHTGLLNVTQASPDSADPRADESMKRRMKLFGDQLLAWTTRMGGLAGEVPALAEAGFGPDALPDVKKRARALSIDHVRELGKCASRLTENLIRALPHGKGNGSNHSAGKDARETPETPFSAACQVAGKAHDLVHRIIDFLYPQAYTVNLVNLKEPDLIESLKDLQKAVSDFQDSAQKAR